MRLLDIETYVRNKTLIETGDLTNVQLDTFINAGLYDLASRHSWNWLNRLWTVATSAVDGSFTMPDNWTDIRRVQQVGKAIPLRRLSIEQALDWWGDDWPTSGDPQYYIIDAYVEQAGQVVPVAEVDLKVYYQGVATKLTDGNQEPEFHRDFHIILAHFAEAEVWGREDQPERARDAMGRYFDVLREMIQWDTLRAYENLVLGEPRNRGDYERVPWYSWLAV